MARFVKIKPGVISVLCGREKLTDKTAVYPFSKFPGEDALDLIKRGFLVEVTEGESEQSSVETNSGHPPKVDEPEKIEKFTDDPNDLLGKKLGKKK